MTQTSSLIWMHIWRSPSKKLFRWSPNPLLKHIANSVLHVPVQPNSVSYKGNEIVHFLFCHSKLYESLIFPHLFMSKCILYCKPLQGFRRVCSWYTRDKFSTVPLVESISAHTEPCLQICRWKYLSACVKNVHVKYYTCNTYCPTPNLYCEFIKWIKNPFVFPHSLIKPIISPISDESIKEIFIPVFSYIFLCLKTTKKAGEFLI